MDSTESRPTSEESAPTPAPSGSEAEHWKEYKDASGRPYYHDSRTNKTTYDKPACLKSEAERTLRPCKWKEYPTPDGRKYFSDGVNSVWVEPKELTEWKSKVAAMQSGTQTGKEEQEAASAVSATTAGPGSSSSLNDLVNGAQADGATANGGAAEAPAAAVEEKKKGRQRNKPVVSSEPLVFKTQGERMAAFVEMLRDYEITSQQRWGDLPRICSEDPRWNALTTTGQKKQTFSEFQTKRAKEEREEKRGRSRKARDTFLKMLAEDTAIDVKTRWREAQKRLGNDDRYLALDHDVISEVEREEMFNDFVAELARKEDEEKRFRVEANTSAFKELLAEVSDGITHATRWLDIRQLLEEKNDPRFEVMDENDRRHVFGDLVGELRKAHEAVLKEKEREKRLEDKAKQASFRQSLMDKVMDGSITALSAWRDCKVDLESEATMKALEDQPTSTARAIFDDVVDLLQKAFKADRKYLRDLLDDESDFKLAHDSTFDAFVAALTAAETKLEEKDEARAEKPAAEKKNEREALEPRLPKMLATTKHVRMVFDELLVKEVAKHEEAVKKRKRTEERYMDLLEDYYYRSDHIDVSWKDAEYEMRRRSAFLDMKDNKERKAFFEKHIARLAKKMGKTKPSSTASDEKEKAKEGNEEGKGGKKDLEDGEEKDEEEVVVKGKEMKKSKRKHSR